MRFVRVCGAARPPTQPTGFAHRWNLAGQRVLYCTEHFSTALLEQLVHMKGAPPFRSHARWGELPHDIAFEERSAAQLPRHWDVPDNLRVAQRVGAEWYERGATVMLIVPSVPGRPYERNVVLNPAHPDWAHIAWERTTPVPWDRRLYLTGP